MLLQKIILPNIIFQPFRFCAEYFLRIFLINLIYGDVTDLENVSRCLFKGHLITFQKAFENNLLKVYDKTLGDA